MSQTYSSLILGNITPKQQEHKVSLQQALKKYLPPAVVELSAELIMYYKLHLHIEVERRDRYGDYHPHMGKGNMITVNHNLNPYEFLVTFIHELAHHTTFLKHGNKVDHHGAEWKAEFRNNMKPFLLLDGAFPDDVKLAVIKHMKSPKYSHSADVNLTKILMKYDKVKDYITLDELPYGALFKMSNRAKIVMKKLEKLRTYTMCISVSDGKMYKVHTLAKVIPIQTT